MEILVSLKNQRSFLKYVLLLGVSLLLTGFFWQQSTTRLQTLFYIFVVSPILLSIVHQVKIYSYNRLFWLALAVLSYTFISTFWSQTFSSESVFHYFKCLALLLSLFFAVNYVVIHFPRYQNSILHVMLILAAILSVYNLYVFFSSNFLASRMVGWGLLENANIAAQVFGVMVIFALLKFFTTSSKVQMVFYFVLGSILTLEIIFFKSRGQMLALAVAILAIINFVPNANLKRFIPVAVIILLLMLYLVFATDLMSLIANRDASFDCRKIIWTELWNSAIQSPIFGRGMGSSPGYEAYCLKQSSAPFPGTHSVYMHVFLYSGLIGVLLAVSLIFYGINIARKSDNELTHFWGIVILYGSICLIANGDSFVSRPGVIWILFWIPFAFISANTFSRVELDKLN